MTQSENISKADGGILMQSENINKPDVGVLVQFEHISKQFGGIYAVNDVTFEVLKGEVLALIGENGAGKSTLMKILCGIYSSDGGRVLLDGEDICALSIRERQQKGISIVHQEIVDFPNLSVARNIYAGIEPTKHLGFVDEEKMIADASKIIAEMNADLNPCDITGKLGAAKRQLTMIAKALAYNSKVIVMDEPNSALTDEESLKLFSIIQSLKRRGISIIYISHRLDDVIKVSERVAIMRDGRYIKTLGREEINIVEMIRLMVGREIKDIFPKREKSEAALKGEVVLDVRNIHKDGVVQNLNFKLRRGEILGVAGLEGSGRTEMAEAVIGVTKAETDICLAGEKYTPKSPKHAFARGITYVPPERKIDSILPQRNVMQNIVISSLRNLKSGPFFVSDSKLNEVTDKYIDRLKIKLSSKEQPILDLSGGNQQKTVIARYLATHPKVIIFNEPTRGIDVGAKFEIYKLIQELANEGIGIMMITSEMNEIMGMSERIITFREGRITAEFNIAECTDDRVLHAMMNE